MTPLMVSGSAHAAKSVREDPFTLEIMKFLGAEGTESTQTVSITQ